MKHAAGGQAEHAPPGSGPPRSAALDVSVIIPTYRRERFVVEAVESALVQVGVTLEVLVIDDSAEGSSAAAVTSIADPRVRYERRAAPSGGRPAAVRNDGIRLARGRYFVFLDDDDRLADGALAALVGALDGDGRAGVAFGVIEPFSDDAEALAWERAYFAHAAARLRACRTRFDLVACLLFKDAPIANSACMVRAEHARAVGGYDPRVAHCEDADFYARAARAFGFVFVDRVVVHKRSGRSSLLHDVTGGRRGLVEPYRTIHESYKSSHGRLEFYALKALGRARR